MRELKFRVWDKVIGKYIKASCGDPLLLDTEGNILVKVGGQTDYIVASRAFPGRFLVEQYTGLRDKNGKEICEGDIVRAYGSKVNRTVEFNKGCFVLANHRDGAVSYRELWSNSGVVCEVVGNVHKNPELI